MNKTFSLQDTQSNFMFGLQSNGFFIQDIEMEDYVQWNVILNHNSFYDGKFHTNNKKISLH